ncbi:hypothetical protein F2Q69_00019417 [Brassica cretica]|uniref:Uncharacterized protein n=1 Tax=Brassica cretica TaxID=69181 RepID=A0A3N6PYH0_BRACR|nr:hypothetical protein F2Q69_00019417 [Brassica cretica]
MEIFMRNDARDRVLFVMLLGEDITISIIVAFIITPNPITTVVMTLLSLSSSCSSVDGLRGPMGYG